MGRALLFTTLVTAMLALAAGLAAAETTPAGDLLGRKAHWLDEEPTPAASFLALQVRAQGASLPPTHPAPPIDTPGFMLDAAELRMDSDTSELFVGVGAEAGSPAQHASASFTNAHAVGTATRLGENLFVFPSSAGSASIALAAGSAAGPTARSVDAVSQLGARDTISADVSNGLELTPDARSDIHIQGDFVMTFWERDASIDATEGHADLQSGKLKQDSAPGLPDARPFVSTARQVYLTVRSGDFHLLADPSQTPLVYATSIGLGHATTVSLTEAKGTIGGQSIAGRSVSMGGAMWGTLQRQGEGIAFHTAGGLQHLEVDGSDVPLTATMAPSPGLPAWAPWGIIGVIGLVATPTALLASRRVAVARRRRVAAVLDQANLHYESLRFDEANEVADRALRMAPNDPDVHILKARLGHHCGDLDRILVHRERAKQLLRHLNASEEALRNAIEAAEETAFHKAEPAALDWIREVLKMRPESWDEMYNSPALRPILDRLASPVELETPYWLQR